MAAVTAAAKDAGAVAIAGGGGWGGVGVDTWGVAEFRAIRAAREPDPNRESSDIFGAAGCAAAAAGVGTVAGARATAGTGVGVSVGVGAAGGCRASRT